MHNSKNWRWHSSYALPMGGHFSGIRNQLNDLNLLHKDSCLKMMQSALHFHFLQNDKGYMYNQQPCSSQTGIREAQGDHISISWNHSSRWGLSNISTHTCSKCGDNWNHAKPCPGRIESSQGGSHQHQWRYQHAGVFWRDQQHQSMWWWWWQG